MNRVGSKNGFLISKRKESNYNNALWILHIPIIQKQKTYKIYHT